VVFVVISGSDNVGCGFAVADIRLSERHYHKKTIETYTLVSGRLRVHLGDEVEVLRTPGQVLTIPINTPHWAESLSEEPARIAVFTSPPWTPEDHLVTDQA
jgi:mannose-6-phosphate isomerase-like protein (cupin superfamily)